MPKIEKLWCWGDLWRGVQFSAHEKIPFSAWNTSGTPSAQDLGCFSALEAVGIPFCAGKDTFFCLESFRGTFRAGIWGVFLLGRRWVSRSAQEKIPFSARNASGAPSAQEMIPFSARIHSEAPSAQGDGKKKAGQRKCEFPCPRYYGVLVVGIMLAKPRKLLQMPR